jgi:subtilase family serine protease
MPIKIALSAALGVCRYFERTKIDKGNINTSKSGRLKYKSEQLKKNKAKFLNREIFFAFSAKITALTINKCDSGFSSPDVEKSTKALDNINISPAAIAPYTLVASLVNRIQTVNSEIPIDKTNAV